jgi:hypothetical protein
VRTIAAADGTDLSDDLNRMGKSTEDDMDVLHVDCGSCVAKGLACGDCVITVLLGSPTQGVELDTDEQAALSALADSGLVPPLRLIPGARRGHSVQGALDWQDYA